MPPTMVLGKVCVMGESLQLCVCMPWLYGRGRRPLGRRNARGLKLGADVAVIRGPALLVQQGLDQLHALLADELVHIQVVQQVAGLLAHGLVLQVHHVHQALDQHGVGVAMAGQHVAGLPGGGLALHEPEQQGAPGGVPVQALQQVHDVGPTALVHLAQGGHQGLGQGVGGLAV